MGFARRTVGGALSASVVLVATLFTAPVRAAEYPTWDEVEAARSSQASTEATIATLTAALDELQAEAARWGDAAVAAEAEASAAQALLNHATERSQILESQSDAAAERSTESASRAAQVAAALYRAGGSDLTTALLLDGGSDDLLARMGSLDQVSSSILTVLQNAEFDRNEADSLAAQAEVARAERDRLASAAQVSADAARAASDAADAAVAEQQSNLSRVYEQLASLKNSTAELEQQYRIGQSTGNGAGSGSGGSGPIQVPGGSVNNPAAAQAFAFAQLAARGFGADQNSCLLWLWNRESGWRTNAYNASSGAYGIPQALPGSKMGNYAADWRTNYETQVMWGLIYIQGRYGSPCAAWAHSQSVGWY